MEQVAVPAAGVEVEDAAGLAGELRVAREETRAILPGLDCVGREPPPDRHSRDLLADPARNRFARELGGRPPRQRYLALGGQLARPPDDLSLHLRGGRPAGCPAWAGPPTPPDAARRTASATVRRPPGRSQAGQRSDRS